MRAWWWISLGWVAAAACSGQSPGAPLRLTAPAVIVGASTSTDGALCDQLDLYLTMVRSNRSEAPVYDGERLERAGTCLWTVPQRTAPVGAYDLVARFETVDPVPSCGGATAVVGAFVVVEANLTSTGFDDRVPLFVDEQFFYGDTAGGGDPFLAVPIPEGEDPDAWRQRYRDAVSDLGLDFDPDRDQLTSLVEIGAQTDPCAATLPPTATLPAADGVEGQDLLLSAVLDPGGFPPTGLGFEVRVDHAHNLSGTPFSTAAVVGRFFATSPVTSTIDPAVGSVPREGWELEGTSSDGLSWQVRFRPQEPFVGTLGLEVRVIDALGAPLGDAQRSTFEVAGVEDPTRFLLRRRDEATVPADAGPFAAATAIAFAEQGPDHGAFACDGSHPPPSARTVWDFRLEDDDFEDDASAWQPRLAAGATLLALTTDTGFWTLRWQDGAGPTTGDLLAQPVGGYTQTLEITAPPDPTVLSSIPLAVRVDPAWNDPPQVIQPLLGNLNLPSGGFVELVVPFGVIEPDRTATAPTCAVAVSDSPCANPLQEPIVCQTSGPRVGATWPFELRLLPGSGFDACPSDLELTLSVRVEDTAPPGAANGPLCATAWCADAACDTPSAALRFTTAGLAAPAVISGGPADPSPATIERATGPGLVHGPSRTGIVGVTLDDGVDTFDRAFVVDLAPPTPSFTYAFPATTLCTLNRDESAREQGAVWEGAGSARVLVTGKSGASCDRFSSVWIDLASPQSAITYTNADLCPTVSLTGGNPHWATVDSSGNFWVTCHNDPTLSRIDASGAMSQETVPEHPSVPQWHGIETFTDGEGTEWLIWPGMPVTGPGEGPATLLLVDLASFDGADGGLVTQTLSTGPKDLPSFLWGEVDRARGQYVFITQRAIGATPAGMDLYRIDFSGAPALEGPVALSARHSGTYGVPSTFVLREPAPGEASNLVDAVVVGEQAGGDYAYLDLDAPLGAFTEVGTRPEGDFALGHGLHASPDRRYLIDLARDAAALYPWTIQGAPIPLGLGPIPSSYASSGTVTVSHAGHLILIGETNTSASTFLEVLYFPASEQGLD